MRKGFDNPEMHRFEFCDKLDKLREINAQLAAGQITWEQRVEMHNTLFPGMGSMDHGRMPESPAAIREVSLHDIALDEMMDFYED